MNTALLISNITLWILLIGLALTVVALARQIGVLHERIAPAGALMVSGGPKVGEASPVLDVVDIAGQEYSIGTVREQTFRGPQQSTPVTPELLVEPGRITVADPEQRRGQLLERIGPRDHAGDQPGLRSRYRPGAERRDQPGVHHGRFPDPGRADDRNQPVPTDGFQQCPDRRIAAEEVLSIALRERREPLVRIPRRRERCLLRGHALSEERRFHAATKSTTVG